MKHGHNTKTPRQSAASRNQTFILNRKATEETEDGQIKATMMNGHQRTQRTQKWKMLLLYSERSFAGNSGEEVPHRSKRRKRRGKRAFVLFVTFCSKSEHETEEPTARTQGWPTKLSGGQIKATMMNGHQRTQRTQKWKMLLLCSLRSVAANSGEQLSHRSKRRKRRRIPGLQHIQAAKSVVVQQMRGDTFLMNS